MTNLPLAEPVRKINVAVVGLGFMGVTHLRAYLEIPGARIAAVCDPVRLPVNGVLPGVAGNIKKTEDIHLGAASFDYHGRDKRLLGWMRAVSAVPS